MSKKLIMPGPQRLFAPMLSTFGGGSARGFNPGGGGDFVWEVGKTINFTNNSVTGPLPPTTSDFATAYSGQDWYDAGTVWALDGNVQTISSAYVAAGVYEFTLSGAQGNDPNNNGLGTGGAGARIRGRLTVSSPIQFNFVVGQRGRKVGGGDPESQPGGGGSFFWTGTDANSPANAAGAGGGGGAVNGGTGGDARTDITGENDGNTQTVGYGGSSTDYSAGGAGWLDDGDNVTTTGSTRGIEAFRVKGRTYSTIGFGYRFSNAGGEGGFGGGGGQTNSGSNRTGGGGGWTGGDGKNSPTSARGGGSKFDGSDWSSTVFVTGNAGNGNIQVERIS